MHSKHRNAAPWNALHFSSRWHIPCAVIVAISQSLPHIPYVLVWTHTHKANYAVSSTLYAPGFILMQIRKSKLLLRCPLQCAQYSVPHMVLVVLWRAATGSLCTWSGVKIANYSVWLQPKVTDDGKFLPLKWSTFVSQSSHRLHGCISMCTFVHFFLTTV